MENLNDFNTILNLTPGRFDDYFMPVINGDKPVDIETLQGMDINMDNEFIEYLKNSMMVGMGVPRNLIDVTSEVDFARSISASNACFVRAVVKDQKRLTPSFTRLYQKLYENEYKFTNDMENTSLNVDISEIKVSFPSPASLTMSNLIEQLQSADQVADLIASQLYPLRVDQRDEDKKMQLKTIIVKDFVPSIDWNKYEKIKEEIDRNIVKDKIENSETDNGSNNPY